MSPATTHSARAQSALRERILSGRLSPGERVFEVPTAEALSVSRTPLREAMARLADEGLLERGRGGYVVAAFSPGEAIDAIELRGVMEGVAARAAAERGADPAPLAAAVAELDALFEGRVEDLDLDVYAGLNDAFHRTLWSLAGSRLLEREAERAARLPFASPSAFLSTPKGEHAFRSDLAVAQSQHRALLEAVSSREGARAEAIAREHARLARRNLQRSLSDGDSAPAAALSLIVG